GCESSHWKSSSTAEEADNRRRRRHHCALPFANSAPRSRSQFLTSEMVLTKKRRVLRSSKRQRLSVPPGFNLCLVRLELCDLHFDKPFRRLSFDLESIRVRFNRGMQKESAVKVGRLWGNGVSDHITHDTSLSPKA